METAGNPVIIDASANLVSFPCITYAEMLALMRRGLAQKEAPIRGVRGFSGSKGGGTDADRGMTRRWEAIIDTTNSIKLL